MRLHHTRSILTPPHRHTPNTHRPTPPAPSIDTMAASKAITAASLLLGMAHSGLALSSVAAKKASVEVPPAGGSRPIAAFGVATGTVS